MTRKDLYSGRWMDRVKNRPAASKKRPVRNKSRRQRPPADIEDVQGELVIEPPPVACPRCGSAETFIYKTLPTEPIYRYRRCKKCGISFKTIQGD